ncbi:MAG: hypothetical protein ACFB9M_13805 [Myxococcota bacterium]
MTPEELGGWLKARLTDQRGRQDWEHVFPSLYRQAVRCPTEVWIPRAQLESLVDAHRTEATAVAWAKAMARGMEATDGFVDGITDTPRTLFSSEAMTAAADVASLPGLVPETWIRFWFAQPAAEALISDTLFRSVRDFASAVPRLVRSLLPSFLGRFAKMGSGAMSAVADELEQRLEPEIRRFVDTRSREALQRAADFAVRQAESETSIASRRAFVAHLADLPLRESLSPPPASEVERVLVAAARHWVQDGSLQVHVAAAVDAFYQAHGTRPMADVLATMGLDEEPPLDAWAQATWPMVSTLLQTEAGSTWLTGLAREILDVIEPTEPHQ